MIRDYLNCARAQRRGLRGSKPDKFNDWILDLLNYKPGDEVVDLFPGTNGIAAAIERRLTVERSE